MAKYASSARSELEQFLSHLNLANEPTVHVNGKDHPTALVVVDFGAPLEAVRLNSEISQDLAGRIRRLSREVLNKDANIRVSSDNYNGVLFWSSVQ